jgi:hypothetical protein
LALATIAHVAVYMIISALFSATTTPLVAMHSVAVTLVHAPGASGPSASTVSPSASLDRLQQSLTAPEPSTANPTHRDRPTTRLSDLLGEPAPQEARPPAGGASSPLASGGASGGEGIDPYAYASLSAAGAQQAADRGLRDQVARCWRRASSPSPVRLRVVLDDRGGLAEAPKVLSPPGLLGSAQSQAVAAVLNAVRACAPYSTVSARAGAPHDLEFR